MSAGPYPELLVSRRDREGARTWEVQRGRLRRGEAWSDLVGCVMRVPFGGGVHGRLVRAHELMHVRVSPCVPGAFTPAGSLRARALECAEEFRVNELLRRVGFDLVALRDGSERVSGRRLVECRDRDELLLFAAAVAGTGAFRDLLAGVRSRDRELAAACSALARELRSLVRSIATARLADTAFGEGGLPAGFATYTHRLADLIERALSRSTPPGRHRIRPGPTGEFAPLILDGLVALDRFVPGAVAVRAVPAPQGRRVVRPSRLVTDPARRCFEGRGRRSGGVVVVDQSGSMSLSQEDLERLIAAAPGALVLGYSQAPGSVGEPNAWVLADRGRCATTVRGGNVGNGVDGPALRYALARRRPGELLIWVCDGQVTDSADHADARLAAECAELVLRHGIRMVPDAQAAAGLLVRPHTIPRGPRLLGRVGASVTAPS